MKLRFLANKFAITSNPRSFHSLHSFMKFVFSAFLLITAFIPQTATAEILPRLYAAKFCELRTLGLSIDDAVAGAVDYSFVPGKSYQVTWNEKRVDADTLNAVLETKKLCPHYTR